MPDQTNENKTPDAMFRFAMSEDGMKLGVNRYFPPNGGKGPSVDLLRRQVAAAGVQLPVDEEAARRIVDAIAKGEEFKGIALVRGVPATEPRDGSLVALGDLNFPVFPESRFARFRHARNAAPGQTIDGRELKPKGNFTPKELTVEVGDNVQWDAANESYVSTVWGMARLDDGVITVDPIPRISEDAITVTGTLHHRDFKGNAVTPAQLEKLMRDMGVTIDMNLDGLDAKLRKAGEQNSPLPDQVIVQGAHPVPGQDGWLEFLVATLDEAGTEDESGRVDFRDRGVHPMVSPGQTIGRYHPATAGEGGIDIYGKTVPASGGREIRIRAGENVLLQEDGLTYESKATGVVVMERTTLSVTECLLISGNVDLTTGNVKVEHGSVKIQGSLQSGFTVSAPGHVLVRGSVESATVQAGGLLEVGEGILMQDGGQILCDGEVTANFMSNARIKCQGDVTVSNEIQNCTIHTQGRLIATSGKGIIQGGIVITRKGVEVNEMGSDLGVATTVCVHIDNPEEEKLRQERAKVVDAIKKVEEVMGTDMPDVILARTPKERRPAVTEVLRHKGSLIKRRKVIGEEINKLQLKLQEEMKSTTIKAKRFVHPGTVIRFGNKSMEISKRLEASTFYWDITGRTIGVK